MFCFEHVGCVFRPFFSSPKTLWVTAVVIEWAFGGSVYLWSSSTYVICRTDCLLGYLLIFSCPTDWVCSLLTSHPFEGCKIHNVVISYIWTDKGSKFYNKQVQDFLKEKHVTHFFSRNEEKANVAERGIKTIKARLSRYMTHIQTQQRGEVLPKIIKSYNATYHRTNNRSPNQVKTSNGPYIWLDAYDSVSKT